MVRLGVVKTVNQANRTARVLFLDTGQISAELRVAYQGHDWMPAIEDEVLCVFTQERVGFIVGILPDGA